MYSSVLLRHSLFNWWAHFFSDVERYLLLLKQVVHVGANNSPLLLLCCKPPSYVPYKGTYVPYDGTFGTPDQGQMLDV